MNNGVNLVVYSVRDLTAATEFYSLLLGVEPYAQSEYYVGFRVGDMEIGLDPHGPKGGPIVYSEVGDIKASLEQLTAAGAQVIREITDVGEGLLIATFKDADGNILGLRQS